MKDLCPHIVSTPGPRTSNDVKIFGGYLTADLTLCSITLGPCLCWIRWDILMSHGQTVSHFWGFTESENIKCMLLRSFEISHFSCSYEKAHNSETKIISSLNSTLIDRDLELQDFIGNCPLFTLIELSLLGSSYFVPDNISYFTWNSPLEYHGLITLQEVNHWWFLHTGSFAIGL